MPKAKKFLMFHERRESWRVSRIITKRAFCPICRAVTEWLSDDQITALGYSGESDEELHFRTAIDGRVLICRESIERSRRANMGSPFKE